MKFGAGRIGKIRRNYWSIIAGIFVMLVIAVISYSYITTRDAHAGSSYNVFTTPSGYAGHDDGASMEVGFKFIPSNDGYISGVRFYKESAMIGTHVGSLWQTDGTRLATGTFTGETASGWQEVVFSTPVSISASTTYVASVSMNNAYISTPNFFTTDIVNGPLTAPSSAGSGGNGVFKVGAGAFPDQSYNDSNYWIDVSFIDGTDADPVVTTVTPANEATNISMGDTVSASFDMAMDSTSLTTDTFIVTDSADQPVAGVVSYNSASKTALFIANDGFTPNMQYTALVKGGTGTVAKNVLDIPLSADYEWSFTTSSDNPCPCSLKDRVNPTGAETSDNESGLELGVKIKPSTNGYIDTIRYYRSIMSSDTSNQVRVWDSTGSQLATATISNQTDYGWQEVKLATPLRVYKDRLYVVSYTATNGIYALSKGALVGQNISSGYITAYAKDSAQNAATGSGNGNGVFSLTAGSYPSTASSDGSYYWIDAVFSTTPSQSEDFEVAVTQPNSDAYGILRSQNITAKFNHSPDGTLINSTTFRLYDSSGNQVAATASYNSSKGIAELDPSQDLTYGQKYTAKLSAAIEDINGISLGSEYAWSFTVGTQKLSDINQGSGGPILVITSSTDKYGKYYAEILRAEGLNQFLVKSVDDLSAAALTGYKSVILAETAISQTQADILSTWVNAGGDLIAMKPDDRLTQLLGLGNASGTLSNAYMSIDTSKKPGEGLVSETIQYKGTANRYNNTSSTAVASLYSDASTNANNVAVTTKSVGSKGGSASMFAYDLAKSVVALHQGNQAWVGQERDGTAPVRTNDLFYGAKTGDVQSDWVNLSKMHIPQADEQQRLLANMIIETTKDSQPMPRFWYLPHDYKAALILGGDDHGQSNILGTEMALNNWLNNSATDCSLEDWECVRASHYIYNTSALTDVKANQYRGYSYEIGDHVGTSCTNYSDYSGLLSEYNSSLSTWRTKYSSLPNQTTHRYHCYVWNDWDSQIKVAEALGIRYNLDYIAYPSSWIGSNGTLITGSGMNMRFTDSDGDLANVRQGVTNLDDQSVTATNVENILDNALGSTGYYGIFGSHYDMTNNFDDTLFTEARERNVPMISSEQALAWFEGRESSTIEGFTGSNGQYNFSVKVAEGGTGLRTMIPNVHNEGTVSMIKQDDTTVSFDVRTVKGVSYAVFNAEPGSYVTTYSNYTPPADNDDGDGDNNQPSTNTGTGDTSTGVATGGSGSVSFEQDLSDDTTASDSDDQTQQEDQSSDIPGSDMWNDNKKASDTSSETKQNNWLWATIPALLVLATGVAWAIIVKRRRKSE